MELIQMKCFGLKQGSWNYAPKFCKLCATILKIMRALFADYAHIMRTFIGFYITHIWHSTSTMWHYIWYISQTCYFHLCRLSSTTQTWCHCQAGYCVCTCLSWLLQRHPCGSPDVQSTLVPLQLVLPVATHTVLTLKPRDHVLCTMWTPLASLQSLRGYSVSCVCCYNTPQYLSQLLMPVWHCVALSSSISEKQWLWRSTIVTKDQRESFWHCRIVRI